MSIRARYADGVLTPLEPTGLNEQCEVTLTISDPHPSSEEATEHAEEREIPGLARIAARIREEEENPPDPPTEGEPQGLAAIVALAEKLNREFPDAWDDFPTDFAKNKKHYLYGHPKEEDE